MASWILRSQPSASGACACAAPGAQQRPTAPARRPQRHLRGSRAGARTRCARRAPCPAARRAARSPGGRAGSRSPRSAAPSTGCGSWRLHGLDLRQLRRRAVLLRRERQPADQRHRGEARPPRKARTRCATRRAARCGASTVGSACEPLGDARGEAGREHAACRASRRRSGDRCARSRAPRRRCAQAADRVARPTRSSSSPSINCRNPVFHAPTTSCPCCVPSSGLSCSAIASRARKILERTVPIGQSIACAMSS